MDMETAMSMVLDTLHRAISQNQEALKSAEQKLREWEVEPGFYSILLSISSNYSVDNHVRCLAVLYFKNGVDKYWRKTAPNAISEEEKAKLRIGLLSNLREPVRHLALQLAVLIAKVGRLDCPREWPDLIPTLLTAVRDPDPIVQHRGLLVLHQVIKTLSSKRLAGDRRLFQELSGNVFSFSLSLWNTHTQMFLQQVSENPPESVSSLDKALLALKILRKLANHGFKVPHESEDVVHFVNSVFDRAKIMLECRKRLPDDISLQELVEKYIIHLTKVLVDLLQTHPFSFIDFIQPSLEFTVYYAFMPAGQPYLFDRFVILCLNIIKQILLCVEYKPALFVEETRDQNTLRAHQIKTSFFTSEILTAMCHRLVGHYFLLTPEDLQLWDSDPETFATEESGECWKYSLRPCTESLFLGLFYEFPTTLTPVVLNLMQTNQEPVSPSDLNAILTKDAIYNAVGLVAFNLYDEVNFDQWFLTTLTQELQLHDGHYRVIRRRVAWLLGQWAGVKFSPELRPQLYSTMLSLLTPGEDMVVRLTVSHTLKLAIDDFEFNAEQFLEYLETAMGLLFTLLKECQGCDYKMHVLYVMSFIVERVGQPIRPYVSNLIEYLPLVWEQASEHAMLRAAIVSTLIQIVKAMGAESKMLHGFLTPVLALSTDMKQDCHIYLVEDGLSLWLACMENATNMTDEFMALYQNMPALMESTTEHIRICISITHAYLLLSPECFLKNYGLTIIRTCDDMLSDLRPECIIIIIRLFEAFIRTSSEISCELLRPLLPKIVREICGNDSFSNLLGVNLCVIARVLLCSQEAFSRMMADAAQLMNESQDEVLSKTLDVWLNRMIYVSQLGRRKVLGLALASLLTVQSRIVIDRFSRIILSIVEALNDITRLDETGIVEYSNTVYCPPIESEELEYESEHDIRKTRLASQDMVQKIDLKYYLQSQLTELRRQYSDTEMQQLMQSLDQSLMSQLKNYGVL